MVLGQPKKTHPKRSKDRVHQMGQTQIYHGHAHAHGLPNDTEYQQVHRLEGGGSRGQVSVQFFGTLSLKSHQEVDKRHW